ncbi:MAG: hypothetical protein ACLQPH_03170 [Acidimicrobiales bacterium]
MSRNPRPSAATKRGRLSALAGVVAVALLGGVTVGVAGVQSAGAATINGPKIEICKSGAVTGSFNFYVNNSATPVSVAVGTCVGVGVTAGLNTVTEAVDPSGATSLNSIQVTPATALVSKSIPLRTAIVNVPAVTGNVAIVFGNIPNTGGLKICKLAATNSPGLIGESFAFTETAGGNVVDASAIANGACSQLTSYQVGTQVAISENATPGTAVQSISVSGGTGSGENLAAGTITAKVGSGVTEVDYTNYIPVVQTPGYLEVCKNAGDAFVPYGPWSFAITNAAGANVGNVSVPAGQCSGDVALPPGNYTVTESFSAPDYVSSITAYPADTLVASNVANGSGTFAVSAGNTTTGFYTNSTQMGYVKVCKTLTAGSGALAGTNFNFNVSDAAGSQVVTVTAPPVGQTYCSPDYSALPLGSVASITEQSQPNVAVVGTSVTPPTANAGSTTTTAAVTVGNGINSATFTNEALGWVEVCKQGDASVGTTSFNFSVNGQAQFPVQSGQCSQAIQVPAGTATVQEFNTNPDFYLANVSTVGVTDPTGARLLSGSTANPATVAVPFGGVNNETVVTFTNDTYQGAFKICTAETSPDAALAGDSFPYTWSYTVNGVTTTGSVMLTVPASGSTCSAVSASIPVVNTGGAPVVVSVTAGVPAGITSVDLAAFGYAGAGSVLSGPATPTGFPATYTFSLGIGMNVTTFTNGATH